jgi:dephospho-CoA kinase
VARDHRAVVVHDVPLLIETGQAESFALLVVVDAPQSQRIDRLVTRRGMDEAAARARVAAQVGDQERRDAADVILDGTGSDDHLRAQVDELWARCVDESAAEEMGG